MSVVDDIYKMLVIKHNAYFGATSPIFPERGQPPTTELLEGDERLRTQWDNVLLRRKEFCEHPNPICLETSYCLLRHRGVYESM